MTDVWSFLRSLWDPLANGAGAVAGVLVLHLWRRFRRRLVTLRWTEQTQSFALSGTDRLFGTVEVLYNGTPVQNLYLTWIQVQNDSSRDLTDLELQFAYRDGSYFLIGAGQTRGSLRVLSFADDYAEAINNYVAQTPEEQDPQVLSTLTTHRIFDVPVLNRGGTVDFVFLSHAPAAVTPQIQVGTDYEGMRLRQRPPKPQFLGVRQDVAAWVGLVAGLIIVLIWSETFLVGQVELIGAFLLGAFVLLVGAGLIHLWRLLVKLLS